MIPSNSPTSCPECKTVLSQFDDDEGPVKGCDGQPYWDISTVPGILFCGRCLFYFYSCPLCKQKDEKIRLCQFMSIEDVFDDEIRDIDISRANVDYFDTRLVEDPTGPDGGLAATWKCRVCHKTFYTTDK